MTFNSLAYLVLLALTASLFFGLPRAGRLLLLIAASVVFYAFWSLPLVALIVLSATVDFAMGLLMVRYDTSPRLRRWFLFFSVATNLGILGYFKYSNFFLESVTALAGRPGEFHYLEVLLPPGISFYTFQSMSYTIDVYRRHITPTRSFLRFFLFVSFFPQLVAGPIERAGHLLTQFEQAFRNRFRLENLVAGGQMIVWGLFLKMCIADPLGFYVDQYFGAPRAGDGTRALLATWGFAIQVFCDFAGYSMIARGSARIFGIHLMRNFDQPYLATSLADYWRRWHISLSTWIRDYLYTPLGGNRGGLRRTAFNVFVVAALSGLWHGAAWNFVLWGLYHGVLMGATVVFMQTAVFVAVKRNFGIFAGFLGFFLQFQLNTAGFVIFRSQSGEGIVHAYQSIGAALARGLPMTLAEFGFVLFIYGFLLVSWVQRRWQVLERIHGSGTASLIFYGALVVCMLLFGHTGEVPFIYFQF